MSKNICIIDYGMGNLGSIVNALSFLGVGAFIGKDADTIGAAEAFILPGVGAFGEAMSNLHSGGLVDILHERVVLRKYPILGICLGMQLMAEESSENGFNKGLGWISGHVERISEKRRARVPHVGWSGTEFSTSGFFSRIGQAADFYYDHSFHLVCDDRIVLARCEYHGPLVAAIQQGNILAVQFHPEKSQRNGLKLLRNVTNFLLGA